MCSDSPAGSRNPIVRIRYGYTVSVETLEHLRLKEIGLRFLVELGCSAASIEVRCPRSRFRADVAGYLDSRPVERSAHAERRELVGSLWGATPDGRRKLRRERCEPRTVIIECKAARSDFLKDSRDAERLLARREALDDRRREIESEIIKHREPHLRQSGEFLFEDLESWDFSSSSSRAYRRVMRDLRQIDRAIHGETKFWLARQYRLADRLYLMAPAGMIKPRERPAGWGVIEYPEGLLSRRSIDESEFVSSVRVSVVAPERDSGGDQRARMLRNIAAAATRESTKRMPQFA